MDDQEGWAACPHGRSGRRATLQPTTLQDRPAARRNGPGRPGSRRWVRGPPARKAAGGTDVPKAEARLGLGLFLKAAGAGADGSRPRAAVTWDQDRMGPSLGEFECVAISRAQCWIHGWKHQAASLIGKPLVQLVDALEPCGEPARPGQKRTACDPRRCSGLGR